MDIVKREQREIQRAMQLDLPVIVGEPIPILCIQMDGTGLPVVKRKLWAGQAREKGNRPTRARPCVFTHTTWDQEGYAIRDPDSTTYVAASG